MEEILDLGNIKTRLKQFIEERDWKKFHSPKNLVMALAGEVGELIEIFQWLSEEESFLVYKDSELKESIEHEMADILTYLIHLSEHFKINFQKILEAKIEINKQKYPADLVKGSSKKYTKY